MIREKNMDITLTANIAAYVSNMLPILAKPCIFIIYRSSKIILSRIGKKYPALALSGPQYSGQVFLGYLIRPDCLDYIDLLI